MPTFQALPAAEPPGRDLLTAMIAEMATLYGPIEGPGLPTATPSELGPPSGRFLVGFDGGRAVCCGGLKRLEDGVAEIKRMYVVPDARGRGVARALLAALEGAARDLGYAIVRLDTGPRQPGAEALYRASGYRPIGNYNANPLAAFWGEKALADTAT